MTLIVADQRGIGLLGFIASTQSTRRAIALTRNVEDFQWIEELKLLNPFEERS